MPSKGLYSKNEIHVLSSAVERCLMTAQSFLAGFFPPVNDLNQLPIQWQPIAVNSVPVKMDKLISQRAICPKYDEMFKEIYTNPSDELKTFIENNTKLFEYISKHTGKVSQDLCLVNTSNNYIKTNFVDSRNSFFFNSKINDLRKS